jgi:fatty acid desaturase
MALLEPMLDSPAAVPVYSPSALGGKRPYDASPAAYKRLRRTIVEAGLLDRQYGYYFWRTLLTFSILLASFAMFAVLPAGFAWAALTAVVMGVGLGQIGMIGHDCGHLQVFRKAANNWLLGQFCFSFVIGVGFWSWRDRHNLHHVETNDEEVDPDLSFGGFFTLNPEDAASRTGLSRLIVKYQAWLFVPVIVAFLSLSMRAEGWRFAIMELRGPRKWIELSVLTLNAVLWLAPIYVLGLWWLAVFVMAQGVGGFYLGMTIAPNHKGMPTWAHGTQLTFLERQVIGSRNILPGPIAEFTFGGLNYQIEHHLFPNMPRVNLGKCHRIVKPFCVERGIPFEECSVWESYRQTFGALSSVARHTT